jgi:hypothetical protein
MNPTNPRLNAEGYSDPTAFEALSAVRRAEKAKAQTSRPLVYICSPFAGDIEANVNKALAYCRFALLKGNVPIAPHCYLPRFMNEGDPAERELALSFGLRFLYQCRELWVFGTKISEGMKREIYSAKRRNIQIKQFNEDMEEIQHGC